MVGDTNFPTTIQTSVNFCNFVYVYLCSLKTFHFQTWQVHGNCHTFFSNRSNLNRIKTWKAKIPQSEFLTWLLANSPFWVSSEGSPQKNVQEAKQKGEGNELELAMITVGFLFTLRWAKWNTIGKKMKSCQLLLLSLFFSLPLACISFTKMQRGRVVSASDWQSGSSRFESRSGHWLDLFSVVPSSNPRPHL